MRQHLVVPVVEGVAGHGYLQLGRLVEHRPLKPAVETPLHDVRDHGEDPQASRLVQKQRQEDQRRMRAKTRRPSQSRSMPGTVTAPYDRTAAVSLSRCEPASARWRSEAVGSRRSRTRAAASWVSAVLRMAAAVAACMEVVDVMSAACAVRAHPRARFTILSSSCRRSPEASVSLLVCCPGDRPSTGRDLGPLRSLSGPSGVT